MTLGWSDLYDVLMSKRRTENEYVWVRISGRDWTPQQHIWVGRIITSAFMLLLLATVVVQSIFFLNEDLEFKAIMPTTLFLAVGGMYGVGFGSKILDGGLKRREVERQQQQEALKSAEAEQEALEAEERKENPSICMTGMSHIFNGLDEECFNGCGMTRKELKKIQGKK